MSAKNIMVVDNSVAVQEMCRQVLQDGGYNVTVASNGVAALTFPELDDVDLLILDTHLRDVSGLETTRQIKGDSELFDKPILLLVPEEQADDRESVHLMGANAWLKKPFDPGHLLSKVNLILEEREVARQASQHLQRAADEVMRRMAESHIQKAVEAKTQIMVERALQMVVTQVDARARREVETRVNALTTEKEQELVKLTVQEVARSTVEKMADQRVREAMERILLDETAKSVKRAADEVLPALVRERVKEGVDQILPKEVTRRVQKEAEELVPEASQKVVEIIHAAAQKIVPKTAREIVQEQAQQQVTSQIDNVLPRQVQTLVGQEIDSIMRQKMEPYLRQSARSLRRRITLLMGILIAVIGVAAAALVADYMFGPLIPRPNAAARAVQGGQPAAPAEAAPAEGATQPEEGGVMDRMKGWIGL